MAAKPVTITLSPAMARRLRHAVREAEYAAHNRVTDARPHMWRQVDRVAEVQYRRLGALICATAGVAT